jgi:hypothetical protein
MGFTAAQGQWSEPECWSEAETAAHHAKLAARLAAGRDLFMKYHYGPLRISEVQNPVLRANHTIYVPAAYVYITLCSAV